MLSRIKEKCDKLFHSEEWKRLYGEFCSAISRYSMEERLDAGALIGFSGGADSVILTLALTEYRRDKEKDFKILLCHVNHLIRGAEADGDEEFCRAFAKELGLEFVSSKIDVPKMAKDLSLGIEEAARKGRYNCFDEIILGRNDVSFVCLAHNSTDNVETVLLNMMRGAGLNGMCGIPPVRDNVLRPLIYVSGREIRSLADEFEIPYVVDSTNLSDEYTRNYVRLEILPRLSRLSDSPEESVTRMTESLRDALSFINRERDEVLAGIEDHSLFKKKLISDLPDALFSAVISELIRENTGICAEKKHIRAIFDNRFSNDFRISLCGEYDFAFSRDYCAFLKKNEEEKNEIYFLCSGKNNIDGYNGDVFILPSLENCSSNIYNFSIRATFSRDIINNGLFMRFKRDGDAYRAGGITKKLKKAFNDLNVPVFLRNRIPVFCDADGIVWVPGLPVRDGAKPKSNGDAVNLILSFRKRAEGEKELFTPLDFKETKRTDKKKGLENT